MTHIAKTQAYLFAILIAILSLATGIGAAIQAGEHSSNRELAERNETEQRFWRAVAGQESTAAVSVDNQLAADLSEIKDNPNALRSFRGDSNLYGGITDAIGFDPFTGQNCKECGPLKGDVLRNVERIGDGGLNGVLRETSRTYDTSGLTLTVRGVSFPVYLFGLWLIGGHLTYGVSRLMHRGSEAEADTATLVGAPVAWAAVKVKQHRSGQQDGDLARAAFPDLVERVEEIDRAIEGMAASPGRDRLVALRQDVVLELRRQAKLAANGRSEEDLQAMTRGLEDALSFLKARSEVREQLG